MKNTQLGFAIPPRFSIMSCSEHTRLMSSDSSCVDASFVRAFDSCIAAVSASFIFTVICDRLGEHRHHLRVVVVFRGASGLRVGLGGAVPLALVVLDLARDALAQLVMLHHVVDVVDVELAARDVVPEIRALGLRDVAELVRRATSGAGTVAAIAVVVHLNHPIARDVVVALAALGEVREDERVERPELLEPRFTPRPVDRKRSLDVVGGLENVQLCPVDLAANCCIVSGQEEIARLELGVVERLGDLGPRVALDPENL